MRLERRKEEIELEHIWLGNLLENKLTPVVCLFGLIGASASAAQLTDVLPIRLVLIFLAAICAAILLGYRIRRKRSR